MTGFEKGQKVYHATRPDADPEIGTIIRIKDYFPGRVAGNAIITIRTTGNRIVSDYENTFTTTFPAICNYWKH